MLSPPITTCSRNVRVGSKPEISLGDSDAQSRPREADIASVIVQGGLLLSSGKARSQRGPNVPCS